MIRNYNTSFSIESGPFIPAALLELILFVSDVSKRKVTGEILFERSSGDFHAEAFYLFWTCFCFLAMNLTNLKRSLINRLLHFKIFLWMNNVCQDIVCTNTCQSFSYSLTKFLLTVMWMTSAQYDIYNYWLFILAYVILSALITKFQRNTTYKHKIKTAISRYSNRSLKSLSQGSLRFA